MSKKISVIIPCFNAVQWLPQCFVSLAKQTIGIDNLELIFVNDASTDEGATWSMLQEFERAFPESIIIIDLEKNMRQGGARNEALKYASGEYIAFVDADDWVDETIYEKTYARAKEVNADILQFGYLNCFNTGQKLDGVPVLDDVVYTINTVEERKEFLMRERLNYGCWNKLYKRSLIEETGSRFAEHVIYEEPLFVYPMLFTGRIYATMSDKLYMYRRNIEGTMYKTMENYNTFLQHANVQLAVWRWMKNTEFFEEFYEEIKLYFLHTYLYETLLFIKKRDMKVTFELYKELWENVTKEVGDYDTSKYEAIIPMQMKLYRLSKQGMTDEMLQEFVTNMK